MADPLLNALHYLCQHYGHPRSVKSLLEGLPLQDGLLSPHLLPRAAHNAGFQAEEAPLSLPQLSPLLLPVIALLDSNQACVLLDIDQEKQRAEIALPCNLMKDASATETETTVAESTEADKTWVSFDELEQQFLNRVFLLKLPFQFDARSQQAATSASANPSQTSGPIPPRSVSGASQAWFWQTLWQSKSLYRDVLIASALLNIFALAIPLFTRLIYDKVVPNQAFDTLWVLTSGMVIIFGFDVVLKYLRSYFIDIASKKSDVLLSADIYRKVMGLKLAARPPSVGAFTRHLQEFESVREFFTSATIASLIDLPFALLFLLVIYTIAGPLVTIPLIAITLLILYSLLIQRPLRKAIEEGSQLAAQKHANLVESVAGLETVKLFNSQPQYQHRWEQAVAHMANWGVKSRRLTDSVHNLAGLTQQCVSVGVIIFGVYLIAAGQLTVGGLIAVSMLTSRAIGPMIQLSQLSTRYHQAKSAIAILSDIMAMPDETRPSQQTDNTQPLSGNITCDNLTFSYPNAETAALKSVSLTIKPGEKVAIIGKIGSGKTTLLRLLMGLYQPSSGSIRFDNTNINQYHPHTLRQQIGCVPQDNALFFGSIRDNITLGSPQASDDEINLACHQAGVHLFTQQEASGLNRQVGEGGQYLSGGQKQTITIARALLNQPKLLIFDEPTSQMDNRSEQHLKQTLKSLNDQHTLILFTHKTSMLECIDRLIVLEQGHVIADGDKEAVLNKLKSGGE
ncbi:peptidase domain-containing ABC transporter [Photobacterium sp. ZSDE20]|uniref:Peptidase domain-containing ABC transporter n=1 Tax=Photobacterium pectinilyticum TaxID=2906793 RepID=A0ABT1N3K3_9GAMM|nr:type I secretion system permease/ATPase [Photobacterium sp. ZSDE20]MCQ1058692.1 peptidase domain-containing ABC transporter [Photobacterium sp. ZSDE20]MDD1823406.1 peptidase domain-containing ABC transporter [Photobacterium sp. ZSDE20]